jgi:hypothetical protein
MEGVVTDKPGPFYDEKVHVLTEKCSTCVFRPGNLMMLEPGRVKDLVEGNIGNDSALTCHQTLPYSGTGADPAVCRGFFDAYADRTLSLRMAKVMNVIEEVEPPTKEEV